MISLMPESSTNKVDLGSQIPAMSPPTPAKTATPWRPVVSPAINAAAVHSTASTTHPLSKQQQQQPIPDHLQVASGSPANQVLCGRSTSRTYKSHIATNDPPLPKEWAQMDRCYCSSSCIAPKNADCFVIADEYPGLEEHNFLSGMDGESRLGTNINELENLLLHRKPINLIEIKTRSMNEVYEKLPESQANHKVNDFGLMEENGHVDDGKTPQQKAKRKKHRPKVVSGSKPAATPKPQTPMPTKEMKPNGKRKYVRKNKSLGACDGVLHCVKVLDGLGSARSVRRSLNFDFEVGTKINVNSGAQETAPRSEETRESQARESPDADRSANSSSKTTQDAKVPGAAENLLSRASEHDPFHMTSHLGRLTNQNVYEMPNHPQAYDLNRVMTRLNQLRKDNRRLPEDYVVQVQTSIEEKASQNLKNQPTHINVDVLDAFSKGTSDPVDTAPRTEINFIIGNEVNQNREFSEGTGHCYNSDKRRKILNMDELSYQPSLASPSIAAQGGGYNVAQLMRLKENGIFPDLGIMSKHNDIDHNERFGASLQAQNFTNDANVIRNNLPFPAKSYATSLSPRMNPCQPRTPEQHSKHNRSVSGFSWIQEKNDILKKINEQASASRVVSMNHPDDLNEHEYQTNLTNLSASYRSGQIMKLAPKYFQDKVPNRCRISSMHDHEGSTAKKPRSSRSTNPTAVSSLEYIIQKLLHLKLDGEVQENVNHENALVPYAGSNALILYEDPSVFMRKRRPRPKVHLDDETSRIWKLLMLNDSIHDDSEMDERKKRWWEEERRVFRGRVDSFIARMHLVQGDRRFSPWKGSVVDSVVGVFLTQNVSDHLSSSAFMSMAARFQPESKQANNTQRKSEITNMSGVQSNSCISSSSTSLNGCQGNTFSHESFNQSSIRNYDAEKVKEPVVECRYSTESESEQVDCSLTEKGRTLQESSMDSSLTAVSSRKSVGNENKQSPDDIASSQTSAFSSQNSSEYPVPTYDPAGTCLGLNLDVEELNTGIMSNSLYVNTSFMDLLRMTERKITGIGAVDGQNSDTFGASSNSEQKSVKEGKSFLNLEKQSYSETQQHNLLGVNISSPTPFLAPGYFDSRFVNLENICQARAECSNASSSISVDTVTTDTDRGISSLTSKEDVAGNVKKSSDSIRSMPTIETCKDLTSELQQPLGREVCSDEQFHTSTTKAASDVELLKRSSITNSNYLTCQDKKADPANLTRKSDLKNEIADDQKPSPRRTGNEPILKRKVDKEKENSFDWDSLRRNVCHAGLQKERSCNARDSVDWEAVKEASVEEISDTIRERGMNNKLAERIKAFLDRLVKDHGAIDLEWLREVPPDKAKEYLLSVRGLGLKSVECVRLLTLHHLAFPVDTNVGRITVRLGWVPLQPLPESLQLHLLELYPVLETIQKYLWPRLCTLDQRTLYELHYQLITFGKVFCTKNKPNCNACPMRAECKHFASAFSSARLALPAPEEQNKATAVVPIILENTGHMNCSSVPLQKLEGCTESPERTTMNKSEPIIEEPASPEPQHCEITEKDIEDAFYEDPDEIPTIKLNFEGFTKKIHDIMEENGWEQGGDMSKALVALSPQLASIPMPKLKNISRLRTEHQVYELPDSHPLLQRMDPREQDDPCFYLLAIWTPGETAQSTEPPEMCCNSSQTGELCDKNTCFGCNTIRETRTQTVRGTLLIPCRTAMRGSFPLNGTYFQVNEVFADHDSSHNPILVPRESIWNLRRRTVYFGTSIPTIFKGLTTEGIQQCFWKGFVCVRGFDRTTRAPKPLYARLHFPASKAHKKAT